VRSDGRPDPATTHDRCIEWVLETFRLLGTETRMGIKLHSAFVAAGLPPPTVRLQAIIGGGVVVGRSEIGAWSRV
jgi:hypothetical protein